jgi:prepilin-type N-terminal cleavage/methylation domain-containing protein
MKRKGFTLIELLIVVAIIGALIAILLPAIAMAWREVHRAQCGTNLKNIFIAMKIYSNANDRFFPSVYHNRNGETWREDWTADDPDALIADHGTTAEVEFKDTDAFRTNTSALWLLVRDGTVNPRQLICPAAQGHEAYFPKEDASGAGGDVTHWWSFKQLKNCSYSYQNTLGRPVRDGSTSPNIIILADVNPLRADVRSITRAKERPSGVEDFQMNSPNHRFTGQNVVDMSGSVYWMNEPKGNKGNNIWVKSTWDRGRLQAEDDSSYSNNTERITMPDDEWLVP